MLTKKQILIAEDNVINREMLAEILSEKYAVLQAENGREALDVLQANRGKISLILLDVMMPVMDGLTFLDRIKKDGELSLIPVIVMTQSDSEEDEIAALKHGATDFVPKPYRPQVILHRVESLITLRENAAMINQLRYDRLTGLYSREFFYVKVSEKLEENPDKEYSIICSNVENFKLYNDTFGTEAGDALLKEIAAFMRKAVENGGLCARLGADRFLCLQEKDAERTDRQRFSEKKAAGNDDRPSAIQHTVIRWGIYEINDRTIPVEQMCNRAQLAAESIKGRYHQYFAVYDDALREKLLREKAITDCMENALKEKQFAVYLQPKYSLKDEKIIGAEALVRWVHPEMGFISPAEFIPLFERNGFIADLDLYVWKSVCSLLRGRKEKGETVFPVSVNVSRADMYRLPLKDVLKNLTEEYGVNSAYLHLEITESAYAKDPDKIIDTVRELRESGFVIEMDDFGSGYSSLNMLSSMKPDVLKLDMAFIRNEIEKPTSQSILSDVINMAHRMKLAVVAEGVETREQMVRLLTEGCDFVQGYFFAKPMPVNEFEKLWDSQPENAAAAEEANKVFHSALPEILIADEDDAFRESVKKAFGQNYRVAEAKTAKDALSVLERDGANVSVIILSMTLSGGASEILRATHRNPALWNIPVLSVLPEDGKEKCIASTMETDDFLCRMHPEFDIKRRVRRLIDVAETHKREKVLRDEAYRDYLTGLYNRRGFKSTMDSLRAEDLPVALCVFDMDNLKTINDSFGHDGGDRAIRGFADILRNNKGKNDVVCRYGGDEFMLVIKRVTDESIAEKKVKAVCRAAAGCAVGENLFMSCSCGIAICGADESPSATTLINRADNALYRAKTENKGGYIVYGKND